MPPARSRSVSRSRESGASNPISISSVPDASRGDSDIAGPSRTPQGRSHMIPSPNTSFGPRRRAPTHHLASSLPTSGMYSPNHSAVPTPTVAPENDYLANWETLAQLVLPADSDSRSFRGRSHSPMSSRSATTPNRTVGRAGATPMSIQGVPETDESEDEEVSTFSALLSTSPSKLDSVMPSMGQVDDDARTVTGNRSLQIETADYSPPRPPATNDSGNKPALQSPRKQEGELEHRCKCVYKKLTLRTARLDDLAATALCSADLQVLPGISDSITVYIRAAAGGVAVHEDGDGRTRASSTCTSLLGAHGSYYRSLRGFWSQQH